MQGKEGPTHFLANASQIVAAIDGREQGSVPQKLPRSVLEDKELYVFKRGCSFLRNNQFPDLLLRLGNELGQNYKMLLLESHIPCTPPPSLPPRLSPSLQLGTAFSGIHCWLLISAAGRQGDVTRTGGRWYQPPQVTGTLTKSVLLLLHCD